MDSWMLTGAGKIVKQIYVRRYTCYNSFNDENTFPDYKNTT